MTVPADYDRDLPKIDPTTEEKAESVADAQSEGDADGDPDGDGQRVVGLPQLAPLLPFLHLFPHLLQSPVGEVL